MIYILDILVEQRVFELDKPFYYYYETTDEIKPLIRVEVSFGHQTLIGFVLNVKKYDKDLESLFSEYKNIKSINSVIDDEPVIDNELFKVAAFMKKRYVATLISCLQTILPKSLKPSSSTKNAAKPKYFSYITYVKDVEKLTKKQQELLDKIKESGRVLKNTCSPSICQKLIALGAVKEEKVEELQGISYFSDEFNDFKLTKDQQEIYDKFLSTDKTTSLLYGVTGSGKTEIYIKLVEHYQKLCKTSILLVPEINLTPYIVDKFRHYFGNSVAILTSGLTDSERYNQYRAIKRGEATIVIGTRSAIFAPLKDIGLIIVDEEFSDNYKNSDENPNYHAIEVAKFRCKENGAKLLLGTATPSVESMAKAKDGQYELLELKTRYNNQDLPNAKLIDMTKLDNLYPGCSFLSNELVYAMINAIKKDEQVILLLNRKGYSTYTVCDECYQTLMCSKCNHPLTYHKYNDTYKCNLCGATYKANQISCPCGNRSFINMGFGVEALETELKKIFKNEQILRLDTNIAAKPKQIANILNKFRNKESHILIGTEMLAKGHDFENVSVIGIVSADQLLNMPYFNVNEKVFQLITQCVGRCGRGKIKGRAYVQTNTLNSYAINVGCAQDYDLFYKLENEYRKNTANPPYFYVSTVKLSHTDIVSLKNETSKIKNEILKGLKDELDFIYIKSNLERYKGVYESTIVLKYKNLRKVLEFLNEFIKIVKIRRDFKINVNIDPTNY